MSLVGLKSAAARGAYTLLAASYRFAHLEGVEAFEPILQSPSSIVVSFWHSRILGCSRYVQTRLHERGLPAHVLVSRSKDGELIARWIDGGGGSTSRGSSTRGGSAALRDVVRAVKDRSCVVVTTPDGPRGPDRRVQPGTILMAQMARLPIYPMSFAAERCWRLRSWDRFIVPMPFSRLAIVAGEPIRVPREADEQERETLRAELERAIERADARAAELCGVEV